MSKNIVIGLIVTVVLGGTAAALIVASANNNGATTDSQAASHEHQNGQHATDNPDHHVPVTGMQEPTKEPATTNQAQIAAEIVYTDDGFDTSGIGTIQVGDTVRFINNSSGSMWVASDEHPTHTIYPEFDQNSSVGSGGTYDFTFERAGTWGFHNHVRSSHTGSITVAE